MQSRTLGDSGLTVTPIGVGLAGVGRPAYLGFSRDGDLGQDRSVGAMEKRTHDLLDAAYEGGVRYVDAARSYGLAERFLGAWLHDRKGPPGDPTVGSKWGYTYVGDWSMEAPVQEVKDHSIDALQRQYAESRAELGQHLLLYQIHSATLETGVLRDRAVLAELARLREQGVAIGLSVSGPAQADVIRESLDARADGKRVFQTVQATWNLLERSAGAALAEAHDAGCGVIVKEALANGRLAAASGLVAETASAHGVNADAVAIAAALANPWAHVVLSGATTVEQLSSNMKALSVRLSAGELDRLGMLTQPASEYWLQRQSIPWR